MIATRSRLPIAAMLTFGLLPSPLKTWWYRLKGAKISRGVRFGLGSVVLAKEPISIGASTQVGMFTAIRGARVSIGKRTVIRPFALIDTEDITIGDDVTISETALIRALVPSRRSRIVIGDRAHVFPFSVIDTTREVVIGEESSVGYGTYIFTHTAYKSKLDGYPVEFGPVHIGKRVWIPCRVFITQSICIGDDAVIGTGAYVASDIPAGVLAVGMPAKPVRSGEQYLVHYSEGEKLSILRNILTEFCTHLEDFAQAQWQLDETGGGLVWRLTIPGREQVSEVELVALPNLATSDRVSVIFGEVLSDTTVTWNREGKEYYSIASRQCSERLSEIGEGLRDFFKRYGIYFARP